MEAPTIEVKEVTQESVQEAQEQQQEVVQVEQQQEAVAQETTETQSTEQNQPAEEAQEQQQAAVEVQSVEIDDATILKYLNEKHSLSADSIDALKPKEQPKLNSAVEAYNKFVTETGNTNFADFMETQRDWSQEPAEVKLMEYLRLENPALSESQLAFKYKRLYDTNDLDEVVDQNEIMEKQINQTTDLRKAETLLEQRKQSFMVSKGLDELVPAEFKQAKEYVDSISTRQQEADNFNATQAKEYFNDSFNGFEYEIKVGEKVEKFALKPENIVETKTWHSSLDNLNQMFFDQDGRVKNPAELYKIAEIARIGVDKFTERLSNTVATRYAEEQDKESKNISFTEDRSLDSPMPKLEVKVVGQ